MSLNLPDPVRESSSAGYWVLKKRRFRIIFHLYPGQNVTWRDELHWTRPSQNWNHMCAEFHSTGVRKNYDASTRRFATTYAEVNVACTSAGDLDGKRVR